MQYNIYGKTGHKVSAVGFGGMRFDLNDSHDENARLIQYAFDRGINYFDTAPGYSKDQSEDIFGLAIKALPRDQIFVSTKYMPIHVKDRAHAIAMVEKSIKRLNADYIDFYHMWCIRDMSHWERAFEADGQYEALLECKERGLIKHIVCSSHLPGYQVKQTVEQDKVEGMLLGINVLNFPYRWEGVQACSERGVGVVAMNPLGGGMIPRYEDKFRYLCQEGETPTEAALRFVIGAPQITVALNGFTTREHIDMACRVADRAKPLSDKEIQDIRSNLNENMDLACTGCNYCKDCPEHIPVADYMQLYNNHLLFDQSDEAMQRYLANMTNWGFLIESGAVAAKCIECGQCERACTQRLPIIDRLKQIATWEASINKE